MIKSYFDLVIYKEALNLYYQTHHLSLELPKYEMYELGSQLRRSSDSIVTNIVEGYGRRRYKAEFVRFLIFSHASSLETICHLNKIQILYPHLTRATELIEEFEIISKRIFSFVKYVETQWKPMPI